MNKTLAVRDRYLLKKYGINQIEYRQLLVKQKGVCKICNTIPKQISLAVDHKHVKGYKKMKPEDKKKYIRGLLCFRCNKFLIGMIDRYMNSKEVLKQIINYYEEYGYTHE